MRIDRISDSAASLGECPLWCEKTRRLWWVDVLTPALWSFDLESRACRSHPIRARRLGSIALREAGGLILACEDGLYTYDPDTEVQSFLVDPEPGQRGHRKNDGRADPYGNFWVGTLCEVDYTPVGRLYRVSPDLTVHIEAEELAIPNALAFDEDGGRMYYADTRAYEIWACEQSALGRISPRRHFATTQPPARPDGSCVDAEGCLWNAEYAGGAVTRYSRSGEVLERVALPVSHPTCCCFGGVDLGTLFITSAAEPLDPVAAGLEPLAGHVLSLRPGVRGRPEYKAAL